MNRRAFLSGMLGVAAVSTLPPTALLEPLTLDWEAAMDKVVRTYMFDIAAYGNAALLYNDQWPYVHNVDPSTLRPFDSGHVPFIH